jgi:hypothetical protein
MESKLWELSDEILNLEEAICLVQDEETLSDTEREARIAALFDKFLQAEGNFEEKALAVASYIKHQEALAEARRQEYRRLRALAEQAEASADKMREYLSRELLKTGKTKIEGATGRISLRKKPPRLILNCEPSELPSRFVKIIHEPRLAEIKNWLKNSNLEVDWASFSESEEFTIQLK